MVVVRQRTIPRGLRAPDAPSARLVTAPKPAARAPQFDTPLVLSPTPSEGLRAAHRPPGPRRLIRETTTDTGRLKALTWSLVTNRFEGFAFVADSLVAEVGAPTPTDDSHEHLRWPWEGRAPEAPPVIELHGYTNVFELSFGEAELVDGHLVTPLPERVRHFRQRALRRAPAPPGLVVNFELPELDPAAAAHDVRDLSAGGMGIWCMPADAVFTPGSELPLFTVRYDGAPLAHMSGVVRHIVQPETIERRAAAGIQLAPYTPEDGHLWTRFVQDLLHPTTRTGGTDPQLSWDLFEASGYFGLSGMDKPKFEPLREPFADFTRKLDAAPELGAQVVYPSHRGIEATVSLMRLYRGTYFPGQLAKRRKGTDPPARSGAILRDIQLRAYEHLLHDPEFRWLLFFVHNEGRWTNMAYLEFPQRRLDEGGIWMAPFEAWAGLCHRDPQPLLHLDGEPLEVSRARRDELPLVARAAIRSRSLAYADALDLVPQRMFLEDLVSRWSRAGLERERDILVARRGGEPLAAAVLELGEKGSHLFKMYDAARLFTLAPDGLGAHAALLESARGWYQMRARRSFVYFLEEEEARGEAVRAGLQSIGGATLLLMSRDIAPDLLEVLWEVTAPLELGL